MNLILIIFVFTGSQMPRHLISDAHEWINEIPTVPIYYLAKPQPRERAWQNQRGKKTLLSLTLVSGAPYIPLTHNLSFASQKPCKLALRSRLTILSVRA